MARQRAGNRRHSARFLRHNGTVDENNNPTLWNDADWTTHISSWPCEVLTTNGNEVVRGRQVTAETRYVLWGEFFGAEGVDATMKIEVGGYPDMHVVAALDQDGDAREMRVDARLEQ